MKIDHISLICKIYHNICFVILISRYINIIKEVLLVLEKWFNIIFLNHFYNTNKRSFISIRKMVKEILC